MAFSNFTFEELKQRFQIKEKKTNLFENVQPLKKSKWFEQTLDLGNDISLLSEKVRSELIVMPILLEMKKKNPGQFSIFSGVSLFANRAEELVGECDFILSKNPETYYLSAPIFSMIEAKDNDIDAGIPQCLAQMIGAKLFNENQNEALEIIYGCVTTGENWQFLQLNQNQFFIDSKRYYLKDIELILGIFQQIIDFYKA